MVELNKKIKELFNKWGGSTLWEVMHLGVKNKLKEIRMREYMMNSSEFCKLLGISLSTYSQIETNKQQGNIETILNISKALNRKVEEIWYFAE